MKTFKIKAYFDIIGGYRENRYEVEAESYEEAIDMIENGDVEPYAIEDSIEECEIVNYEKISEE